MSVLPVIERGDAPETRVPLVLVCGPWSSGTSAVAGVLARAGLFAPGPYVQVNDERTPETVEMRAFRDVLRSIASEHETQRLADRETIVTALRQFRDGPLADARRVAGIDAHAPILLKHALAVLVLPELESVFDLKIVGVLRPLDAIEATRHRRRWARHLGSAGAKKIYANLFNHLLYGNFPFHLVRFHELRAQPGQTLDALATFLALDLSPAMRAEALAFIDR